MFVNVDIITPFNKLFDERFDAEKSVEALDNDLLEIKLAKRKINESFFRRIFQRRTLKSLDNQEKSLTSQRAGYQNTVDNLSLDILEWEEEAPREAIEASFLEQIKTMAESEGLVLNDWLEISAKLSPERYEKYEKNYIQEFRINDYDVSSLLDMTIISTNQSFGSIEEFYNTLKEKGGLLSYSQEEQNDLRKQLDLLLQQNEYSLVEEIETVQFYSVENGQLSKETTKSPFQIGEIVQDISTGNLKISIDDDRNVLGGYLLKYEEKTNTWSSDGFKLTEDAVKSLNSFVHFDHAEVFGNFYEQLPDNERIYVTLLNETNRERLDNAYADTTSGKSFAREKQLKQFEKYMKPERISELRDVYNKHVHVGLSIDSPFINMDQLHLVTSKYDLSKEVSEVETGKEYSPVYHLGGEYALVVEGGQYLETENTMEIIKWAKSLSGLNPEVVGTISNLTKSEAKEIMSNPFDANLEHYTVTVGKSGTIQNVDSLSDVLVTIGELSNNPRIPENIALRFSAAGKDEIAEDIQRSIEKHEKRTTVVNQLNQLTDDQRTVIDLSIGQEFLSEEMSRISEGIVEEEGLKSYFDDQQQNTSGISRSISSSENRLQTVKDRLDPEQKEEVDSLIDSVHYEVLNELMEQAAIKRTENNAEIVEEVEQEEECSMSM